MFEQERLDILSEAGVPIWATELDVQAQDEQTRADYYETAVRALFSHPNVEGILLWGFWDKLHWRGEKAALVKGDNFEVRHFYIFLSQYQSLLYIHKWY